MISGYVVLATDRGDAPFSELAAAPKWYLEDFERGTLRSQLDIPGAATSVPLPRMDVAVA